MTDQEIWDVLHDTLMFPRCPVCVSTKWMMEQRIGSLIFDPTTRAPFALMTQQYVEWKDDEDPVPKLEALALSMAESEPVIFGVLPRARGVQRAALFSSPQSPIIARFIAANMGPIPSPDFEPFEPVNRLDVLFGSDRP